MSMTGSLIRLEDSHGHKMTKKVRLDTTNSTINNYPNLNASTSTSCSNSTKVRVPECHSDGGGGGNDMLIDRHRLHLNTLWSIWYGILVTLFQGFLVVQGAHRFLSCSLITWKMDVPTLEINIQLILCVVAIIFLPLFLASSFFKVGNLANDGFKLGDDGKNCTAIPENGLEHEANGGTCRTLWTHGGPTSAFIHIITALCLLVPRLLLESRLIQDGFLPKENIWRTDLDFMVTHKDRLVILSFITSPYRNITNEHPNQSVSDIFDEFPNNFLDETRLIERYQEKFDTSDEYDDDDDDDDENELIESQELDNDSFITFSTDIDQYNDTFAPLSSTTTTTELITTSTSSSTTASSTEVFSSSTRRSGRKKNNKNGRYRGSNSDELELDIRTKPRARQKLKTTTDAPPKRKLKESNIKFVRPERVPENAVPSTPVSTNSKIIEIKPSQVSRNLSRKSRQHSDADLEFEIQSVDEDDFIIRDEETGEILKPSYLIGGGAGENISLRHKELEGVAGIVQRILGNQETFDQVKWHRVPSLEFLNLALALLVWSVRYPSVFWATSKSFTFIFTLQMASSALDILIGWSGVSVLYRHQVVGDPLPIHAPPLLLNATVTLSLYLLAVLLILCSSMVLYLYGHGRLASVVRDRKLITMKGGEVWSYFAHCASFCFVLAISVVKAPLMYDWSATYRGTLDGAVLASALCSVTHLFIWIVIWLGLTAKRRWHFKLPPLEIRDNEAPGICQPLLAQRPELGRTGSEESGGETIYWPKINPNSPKLKVTFNEVPNHIIPRHAPMGSALRVSTATGEPDDGDYATLRGPNGDLLHLSAGRMHEYGNVDHADDTSEEGKLLACVIDDSVTYASTRDLEPPLSNATLSPANSYVTTSEHLMSPVSVVTVHSSEVHISTATPRYIRRADSGMPPEALTPRSDTETESSVSPPERASSESSGVHSSEEGKDEVVIRPRAPHKTIIKPAQPAIQEEPFCRSTNMRMSSFNVDAASSATLPIVRNNNSEPRNDLHCSTMPLPVGAHQKPSPMYQSVAGSKVQLHTTLPNGVQNHYASNQYMRRMPMAGNATKPSEIVYGHLGIHHHGGGHRTFSKLITNDPLNNATHQMSSFGTPNPHVMHDDRDSANYSMISDQDREMYMNIAQLQLQQQQQQQQQQQPPLQL